MVRGSIEPQSRVGREDPALGIAGNGAAVKEKALDYGTKPRVSFILTGVDACS